MKCTNCVKGQENEAIGKCAECPEVYCQDCIDEVGADSCIGQSREYPHADVLKIKTLTA